MTRRAGIHRSPAPGSLAFALVIVGLGPSVAEASNRLHPRTPVLWTDAPCMTIIDRSRGPIYPLEYGIPFEDTELTEDEVPDSRTHQFFVFCRDHHREELLPGWITEADLAMADAHGLGSADAVDTELEVLDNSPEWAGCWARINEDHERRPITFEAAAAPVLWDTGALPAGAYAVEGYTYEPWANEWWPHPGVFKIIDDPDPAATGPAAALTFPEQLIEFGANTAVVSGCVDAMDGATMSVSWALSGFGHEPVWHVFAADLPASSGGFELDFDPPLETISNALLIKLNVSDPLGRSWTAYANYYISVVESFAEDEGCDEGGGFIIDPCDDDDGAGETGSEAGDTDGDTSAGPGDGTTSTGGGQDSGGSCNCSTHAAPVAGLAHLAWWWSLLGVVLVRRTQRKNGRRAWLAARQSASCGGPS